MSIANEVSIPYSAIYSPDNLSCLVLAFLGVILLSEIFQYCYHQPQFADTSGAGIAAVLWAIVTTNSSVNPIPWSRENIPIPGCPSDTPKIAHTLRIIWSAELFRHVILLTYPLVHTTCSLPVC
jgi:hypothetical protein